MFFDGNPTLERGQFAPERQTAGHGLVLKEADAAQCVISSTQSDGDT
jgi:hypothetical protein